MRLHPTSRDRHAAAFFGGLALVALAAAVAVSSLVLAGIAAVAGATALVALRGYPVDRDW